MLTFWDRMVMRWNTFIYNFGWANYVDPLDGWIARLSFAVPIIGYLILFNDNIAQNLTFRELTSGHSTFGLSGGARLKFLYLGLVFVGLANILYRWQRPHVLRHARDQVSYVEMGIRTFSIMAFIDLHGKIRHSGSDAYTPHGKYYDAEWDAFLELAIGKESRDKRIGRDPTTAHWVEAKAKYESLLRGILIETFFRETTRTRRDWLVACLSIAGVGYVLLAVPSLDLFIKVMAAIIAPLIEPPV
ncbi:hypothetical protein [Rhizobium laguerreae]|uniref:hypothetical protein n=1 Tax=Rhizobium laguerreae TaxID=1076926 RepID=UPI001C924D2D|nr:hypothetical protein [Rhizobium laguerreae]MBY3199129.1 hypothetical protein [Rhizobium laguerreae]MBY3334453.1 hypothetical protein [Rhizobium laguerreae]